MTKGKSSVAILCLFSFGLGAPFVAAQAASRGRAPGGPTVTRLVQLFTRLETEWMDAARRKDETALGRFLADDYELRASARPGEPIPRAEWLQGAMAPDNVHSFTISQMAVRELGGVALVSFLYHEDSGAAGKDGGSSFFVVDAWVEREGVWEVKARYANPLERPTGPGNGMKMGEDTTPK
jgi:ketosteroid isomerase-like protein